MTEISKSEFEAYEALILSGQIEQDEVAGLMIANPEFATWYKARRPQNTKWSAQLGCNDV